MASEQGPSRTPEDPNTERPSPSVTINCAELEELISTVVRRELAAHQRCTDTSPTDGGELIEVVIVMSAIPSHGGIEGEGTVAGHVGHPQPRRHRRGEDRL